MFQSNKALKTSSVTSSNIYIKDSRGELKTNFDIFSEPDSHEVCNKSASSNSFKAENISDEVKA